MCVCARACRCRVARVRVWGFEVSSLSLGIWFLEGNILWTMVIILFFHSKDWASAVGRFSFSPGFIPDECKIIFLGLPQWNQHQWPPASHASRHAFLYLFCKLMTYRGSRFWAVADPWAYHGGEKKGSLVCETHGWWRLKSCPLHLLHTYHVILKSNLFLGSLYRKTQLLILLLLNAVLRGIHWNQAIFISNIVQHQL